MKKVYTAGFDIFYPDAGECMEDVRKACYDAGFEPYFQEKNDEKHVPSAEEIFTKNLVMIDDCDMVAANLNPFRGEMDCGTAFEIGYAFARGKPIYGYMEDARSLKDKHRGITDEKGFSIEDFGYPINLMIGCSTEIAEGSLEDCLKVIAGKLEVSDKV